MAKKRRQRRRRYDDPIAAVTEMTGMALTAGIGVYAISNVFDAIMD